MAYGVVWIGLEGSKRISEKPAPVSCSTQLRT